MNGKNHSLYHYDIDLPDRLDTIFESDFWMMEHVSARILSGNSRPFRFEQSTSIFVRRGTCEAEINLIRYNFTGPCLINIGADQILTPKAVSDDFDASFVIIGRRLADSIHLFLQESWVFEAIHSFPVMKVPDECVEDYDTLITALRRITSAKDNPSNYKALLFTIVGFIYSTAIRCYAPYRDEIPAVSGRLSSRFLQLVRRHFRSQRFLEFYADALQITSKHLSRTVRLQTGVSATDWIERYVITEAKLLLRNSDLNVQQIAEELHFPSQSIFGKYFKKATGQTPSEYRNTQS